MSGAFKSNRAGKAHEVIGISPFQGLQGPELVLPRSYTMWTTISHDQIDEGLQ